MNRRRLLHAQRAFKGRARSDGTKPQLRGGAVGVRIKGHQRGCSPPHSTQPYYPHSHRHSNDHRIELHCFLPPHPARSLAPQGFRLLHLARAATLLDEGWMTRTSIYRGFGGKRNSMLYRERVPAGAAPSNAPGPRRWRRMMEVEISRCAQKTPWREPPARWIWLELEHSVNKKRELSPGGPPSERSGPGRRS